MKKKMLEMALLGIAMTTTAENSATTTKVLEYVPAPGQFINTTYSAYNNGDDAAAVLSTANQTIANGSVLTLGAFGGYIVLGFDHSVLNKKNAMDFSVNGNAFSLSASEPATVSVSIDRNKNGLADDEWFELAGSEYRKASTIKNYAVTYYKPENETDTVKWTDNLGGSGTIFRNNFHTQNYYPKWMGESYTLRGTLIANDETVGYGYADNAPNSDILSRFDIDWAVDSLGRPVHLSRIDFVRIQNARMKNVNVMGESSSEIGLCTDLHPSETEPFIGENYSVADFSGISLNEKGYWADTYTENAELTTAPFVLTHSAIPSWNTFDGFTLSANDDNNNYGNNFYTINSFGCMDKGGYEANGTPFLLGYYSGAKSTSLSFEDKKTHNMIGVYVCASPLSYYSHFENLNFTRKFTKGDYFKLTAIGLNNGTETGSVDFYLADFTSSDSTQWYANRTWEWMDLSTLQNVDSVIFTMKSTDTGTYGTNTATYFCMDKLTATTATSTTNKLTKSKINNAFFNGRSIVIETFVGQHIYLYNTSGTLIYSGIGNGDTLCINVSKKGIYVVNIDGNTKKIIVK